MKQYALFCLMILFGLQFSSFCMTRGYKTFKEIVSAYNHIGQKDTGLKIASENIWNTCFAFAKMKEGDMGKAGKVAISLAINIDKAAEHDSFFKKKVTAMLKRTIDAKKEETSGNKGFLFEKKQSEIEKEVAKDILCLGVYLAKENKEDFMLILSKVLRWAFNWGWVKKLIHSELVKKLIWIEGEIEEKVTDKIVIMQKGQKQNS